MGSTNQEISIIPSVFKGPGLEGDFAWMITQAAYQDAFFIFNDNQSQFLAHRQDPNDASGCAKGGGNAVIRPWQCTTPPRAGGIPTGPGFSGLSPEVKTLIDAAIAQIRQVVIKHNYRRIFFSSDGTGGLGTSIFIVPEAVKRYIVEEIYRLGT